MGDPVNAEETGEITMIRIKQNGIRAVIHPQTGIVTLCDALTFSLLDALTPPFSEEFPMGLRYSFAKYDSADLKSTPLPKRVRPTCLSALPSPFPPRRYPTARC